MTVVLGERDATKPAALSGSADGAASASLSPRTDGLCVVCLKPKTATRKSAPNQPGEKTASGKEYTRMAREMWLRELEQDPFCSRPCCESYYGVGEDPWRVCVNEDCQAEFKVTNNPRQAWCSPGCREADKTRRKRSHRRAA